MFYQFDFKSYSPRSILHVVQVMASPMLYTSIEGHFVREVPSRIRVMVANYCPRLALSTAQCQIHIKCWLGERTNLERHTYSCLNLLLTTQYMHATITRSTPRNHGEVLKQVKEIRIEDWLSVSGCLSLIISQMKDSV